MRPPCVLVLLSLLLGACPDKQQSQPGQAPASVGSPQANNNEKAAPPPLPEKGPLAQRVLYEEAKSLLRAGKLEAAVKAFRRAIASDEEGELTANCYLGVGSALGELGQQSEAVAAYRQVVALRPTDPEGYRALAIGLEDAGELAEAKLALEQSLTLDPSQLSAYQDLAGIYLRDKDAEGAKQVYLRYELKRTELIKTLGLSRDEEQRLQAALALGEARDEATAKALGLALTDKSPQVRLAVIEALGRQGLQAGAGPLKQLLERSQDPQERRAIQLSLQAIAAAEQPPPEPAPAAPAPGAAAPAGDDR